MAGGLRALIAAAALLLPSAALAQVQVNQTFNAQGPAPDSGSPTTMPPAISNSGAVQAILSDPALGANTMFLGATNGGIWRTTNGGTSWTPLTNNQASLSIASLGVDPTDPSGKTLIAGTGATSNGTFPWPGANGAGITNGAGLGIRGGASTGLLYSTDGGNSWSAIGTTTLSGMSVIGVAARGSTILVATFEPKFTDLGKVPGVGTPYGLYVSTNGGQTFALASGLPSGPVSSLVADPRSSNTFYAAVTGVGSSTSAFSQTGRLQGRAHQRAMDLDTDFQPVRQQQRHLEQLSNVPQGGDRQRRLTCSRHRLSLRERRWRRRFVRRHR